MAKRPLTKAEIAQRRAAARLAGRPAKRTSRRGIDEEARARVEVAKARMLIRSVQGEAARTLIAAMRGTLPGSTAQSMAYAADRLQAKGGITDVLPSKTTTDVAPRAVRIGVDPSGYPAPIEDASDADRSSEDGSALAH